MSDSTSSDQIVARRAHRTDLALIADPVESVRRAWQGIAREIRGHIAECASCRPFHPCPVRARLAADEERAYGALTRALGEQP